MVSVRPSLRPLSLLALTVALAAGTATAHAQSTGPGDPSASPLYGDPWNPQRFRTNQPIAPTLEPTGLGEIPDYTYRPGIGAGTTGFDSTNAKRRKLKPGEKPKPGEKVAPSEPQLPSKPPRSPAIGAAKLPQNQFRPGAPVLYPGGLVPPYETGVPFVPRKWVFVDDAPFDPIGIGLGAFRAKPGIEFVEGYDSNPNRTPVAKGSWFTTVAPDLFVTSNWERHELTATLRGSYTTFASMHSLDRPDLDARIDGRVDVTRSTRIELEARTLVFTDNPGSPNIQADLAKLPIATSFRGMAGLVQDFNRFQVALRGSVDRTSYQPSTFVDGETESNDDRNFNRYLTLLRLSYELTPGIKPFFEGGVDRRVHDLVVDRYGLRRDSDGRYAKVGTTFELSRILIGDVSVGYLTRHYQDPLLTNLSGMLFDSSLTWLASALTTVKLAAVTTANETTLPGVSGIFSRDMTLQVDHAFRRWLIGTLKFGVGVDTYDGADRRDNRYLASAGIVFKLTRELQLRAELRRDWRRSNTPGNDYTANMVLFGVRLQR